jgi:hypothetical protein
LGHRRNVLYYTSTYISLREEGEQGEGEIVIKKFSPSFIFMGRLEHHTNNISTFTPLKMNEGNQRFSLSPSRGGHNIDSNYSHNVRRGFALASVLTKRENT